MKLYKYTFHLVGLGINRSAIAEDRDDAARAVYDTLTEYQLEQLEWADLIHTELVLQKDN